MPSTSGLSTGCTRTALPLAGFRDGGMLDGRRELRTDVASETYEETELDGRALVTLGRLLLLLLLLLFFKLIL